MTTERITAIDVDALISQLRHLAINADDALDRLEPTQRKRLQLYAALLVEQIDRWTMEESGEETEVQP